MIIVQIGVIGSGKDHQASLLEKQGFKIFGFSDGVRDFASKFLGISFEEINYEEFKLQYFEVQGRYFTGRNILENVAQEMKLYFGDDFWAKHTKEKAYIYISQTQTIKEPDICFKDCRYPKEAYEAWELARITNQEIRFVFRNYISKRYEIRDHDSEYFAQRFLNMGFKDGDDITSVVKNILKVER